MSRDILEDIINDFSPDKFTRFFRGKNRFFTPRQEAFGHYNDEDFTEGLKIGEVSFAASEKLVVCAFKATRPLSERSCRKAQYEKGKKILKETQSDAGIFIFYDSRGNFRFSLIYPEAVGNRRQWSNFRRFTYFVSREFTNKTFLARVGDGDFPSLDKIKDAFSVEKVTKEFYEQYRKLFEALVADLNKNRAFQMVADKNRINTSDFAKKLLGQIVFLYFLQKKGWLGVPQNKPWGEGDKNFISNLYKQAVEKKENFFNDYLEVLFYDTLNNAHREGADPSFSRHFNCRIPFLNGGLFEPEYDWHGTKIYLENGVFKNIFEVFDRYNFTVEEESPDDKEVAVDPEMLGKVFENLLEENLRKGKGTYYTPREIVHYMCRESLVNYLVSRSGLDEDGIRSLVLKHESGFSVDEARTLQRLLADIKACDPACGSGAFLVGMLNEIVNARLALDPKASEYGLKKETIQDCIYGVDIDPGAVEIAKLRLWLSLVVDYELADIEPLPNLDYKIMCGNSLLEELIVGDESIELFDPKVLAKDKPKRKVSDKVMQIDLFNQDAEKYLGILRKLHLEYFHETDTQKKKAVRGRIEKIELDFIQSSVDKRVKEVETQIRNLNMQKPEDRKKNAGLMKKKLEYLAIPNDIRRAKVRPYFLWHLNFFEVFQEKGGFDIVIANPPYISYGLRGTQKMEANYKTVIRSLYPNSAEYKISMYALFMDRAIQLCADQGLQSFIVPDSFLLGRYFSKVRDYILRVSEINNILLLPYSVFDATVGFSVVYLFRRRNKIDEQHELTARFAENNEIILQGSFKKFSYPQSYFHKLKHSRFRLFFDKQTMTLVSKIESDAAELGTIVKFSSGLIGKNGQDSIISNQKKGEKWLKGIISGGEIKRYVIAPEGNHLLYDKSKIKSGYECVDYFKEKLFMRQTGDALICAYDEEGLLALNNVHVGNLINNKYSLKYIASIINSKLFNFYYKSISLETGRVMAQTDIETVEGLPIRNIALGEQKPFIDIVDKILIIARSFNYLQNSDKQAKVQEYERQIDQMVYKLYGLTEEEIKIVEGDSSAQNASELVKNRLDKAGSV